jgi:hypothetical protein
VRCPNDGFTGTRDHIVIPAKLVPAKAGSGNPAREAWIPDQVRNPPAADCEAVAERLHYLGPQPLVSTRFAYLGQGGQAGGAGDGVAVQSAEPVDVGTVSAELWW